MSCRFSISKIYSKTEINVIICNCIKGNRNRYFYLTPEQVYFACL